VSPVRYELGFCIPEDDILHSDRRENLKSYTSYMHCEDTEGFRLSKQVVYIITAVLQRPRKFKKKRKPQLAKTLECEPWGGAPLRHAINSMQSHGGFCAPPR
jgi:hypothetical protein